jgi:hypothetical protein
MFPPKKAKPSYKRTGEGYAQKVPGNPPKEGKPKQTTKKLAQHPAKHARDMTQISKEAEKNKNTMSGASPAQEAKKTTKLGKSVHLNPKKTLKPKKV